MSLKLGALRSPSNALPTEPLSSMSNQSFISTLDKQRICVNTQLKSSKKAIKMKCVRTEKQF